MPKLITQCLACGSVRLKKLAAYARDHLVSCRDCGLVFSERSPDQMELNAIYSNYTRDDIVTGATASKNEALAKMLLSCLHTTATPYSVLDIACGSGVLLEAFKNENCAVFGTEFDARTVQLCRSKGFEMLDGGLLPATTQQFDLIVFTEVIEHIQNPLEVVGNIRRLLKNGGILYFTTPNFGSLERRLFRQNWGMISYPEHLTYYTKHSIRTLMRKLTMSEVFLETTNISVFRIIQALNASAAKAEQRCATESVNQQPLEISDKLQKQFHQHKSLRILRRLADEILDITRLGSSLRGAYRRSDER